MDLSKQIKELARNNDIDYVGIAPVERFKEAPQGHRPYDILPGAESVISMGVRMNRGPQLTQRMALANKKYRHAAFSYRWFAYGLINMYFLDRAASLVAKLLEENGHLATPIVASGIEDSRALMAPFSNRHAAVAAGLGQIGWNQLCLTPDNGPRQRFVSVITTAKLEPDRMYEGPKLCRIKECTKLGKGLPLCARLCPGKLFSATETVQAVIGGKVFTYSYMDHQTCGLIGTGLTQAVLGPEDAFIPAEVNWDTRVKFRDKAPPRNLLESSIFGRGHFCGICLLRCPVGAPEAVDEIMKSREEGYLNEFNCKG